MFHGGIFMKKKMCVLIAAMAMLAVSSAVCKEVSLTQENGHHAWKYYTGKKGTSSYKLDWKAFYKRMDKVANSGQYRYIWIYHIGSPKPIVEADLSFAIQDDDLSKLFFFATDKGTLAMWFTYERPRLLAAKIASSYSDAVKIWNYYIDLM